eukprot:5724069-Amphidinium_carterae.1
MISIVYYKLAMLPRISISHGVSDLSLQPDGHGTHIIATLLVPAEQTRSARLAVKGTAEPSRVQQMMLTLRDEEIHCQETYKALVEELLMKCQLCEVGVQQFPPSQPHCVNWSR